MALPPYEEEQTLMEPAGGTVSSSENGELQSTVNWEGEMENLVEGDGEKKEKDGNDISEEYTENPDTNTE
ncbi:hypothetical protein RRG08_016250 [Elysia crispata]|uniref:Uncharacterized protein n=1 Tax=Elysia crispata TaxID=231223 RepID=A0AAE1E095_9GAST|nr:hypothetical protein RRG08_016250 [Elysia crispata]